MNDRFKSEADLTLISLTNRYNRSYIPNTEFTQTVIYPFYPTEFIHFTKLIGKEGAEKLLNVSVQLFGQEAQEKEVLIDSTVQEKNITYPTDAKLHKRIIEKINAIAMQEKITHTMVILLKNT